MGAWKVKMVTSIAWSKPCPLFTCDSMRIKRGALWILSLWPPSWPPSRNWSLYCEQWQPCLETVSHSYPNCKESPHVFSRLLCWMLPRIKEQVGNEISELTGLGSHMISSRKASDYIEQILIFCRWVTCTEKIMSLFYLYCIHLGFLSFLFLTSTFASLQEKNKQIERYTFWAIQEMFLYFFPFPSPSCIKWH